MYTECSSTCRTSCHDIESMSGQCEEKCVPGCACLKGTFENSAGNCVPIDQCDCFDIASGKSFPPGYIINRKCGKW